jgi:membrane associated rhomboid family serine protease
VWFVYQLIEAKAVSCRPEGSTGGTAFFAHVGGFVFGVGAAIALVRPGRREGRFGRLPPAG